jgi:hypothetical protein
MLKAIKKWWLYRRLSKAQELAAKYTAKELSLRQLCDSGPTWSERDAWVYACAYAAKYKQRIIDINQRLGQPLDPYAEPTPDELALLQQIVTLTCGQPIPAVSKRFTVLLRDYINKHK